MDSIDYFITCGLEQLGEGFGIFDDKFQLVKCNELFQKLRGYPEELTRPGTTLEAMIRFNAERGDFGDGPIDPIVSSLMTEIMASDQRVVEREMADGLVLKIRYKRLESGGVTITYEDVTDEHKTRLALEASEERHSLVVRASSDGLYDWDVVTDKLYVSDHINELYGLDARSITARNWQGRVHKDDVPVYAAAMRDYFKGGGDHFECEYRILGKDGRYRHIRDHGIGVRDEGRVIRLVGAVQDITDVKAAEVERDKAEKRLLDSLETIADGFLLVDSDDKVVIWNRRYQEIFGGAANSDVDLIYKGRPFLEMIRDGYERCVFKPHPLGLEGWISDRREARKLLAAELEIELRNGQWILINERQMTDGGRVSVYTDITEFKKREAELSVERARFEDAIEAISSGFSLFDAEDFLIVCNSKYREYFDELKDVVIPGAHFSTIIETAVARNLFPEASHDPEKWMKTLLKKRAATIGIREQHLENDLWLQISDHRTKDGGIVSIYTDISLLKERETDLTTAKNSAEQALEDLRKTQDLLVQSEKMASLGQLTAGIAHEIKNPLNFVNNFASLSTELVEELVEVLKGPVAALDVDEREDAEDILATITGNLEKINTHGKRADGIVKNMLLHSRDGPSEMQNSNLNALAEEALNLAYHGARAEHRDFNIEIEKTLGDVGTIDCYPQDLMRVFLNVITNGIYAANKRKIAADNSGAAPMPLISIRTHKRDDQVVIEFRDNGAGIPLDIQEKIFTPFFTTKPAGEGTGLGLSLSYDIIVKQHGGAMTVDSLPGEYTNFTVTLPCVTQNKSSMEGAG